MLVSISELLRKRVSSAIFTALKTLWTRRQRSYRNIASSGFCFSVSLGRSYFLAAAFAFDSYLIFNVHPVFAIFMRADTIPTQ